MQLNFDKVVLINSNFTLFILEFQCDIPFYVEYSDLSVLFTLLGKRGVTIGIIAGQSVQPSC